MKNTMKNTTDKGGKRGVIWQNDRYRVVVMWLNDSWYPNYEELKENSMGENGWVTISRSDAYSHQAAMEQFIEGVLNNADEGGVNWKVIS